VRFRSAVEEGEESPASREHDWPGIRKPVRDGPTTIPDALAMYPGMPGLGCTKRYTAEEGRTAVTVSGPAYRGVPCTIPRRRSLTLARARVR